MSQAEIKGNNELRHTIHAVIETAIDSISDTSHLRVPNLISESNLRMLDFQTLLELSQISQRLGHQSDLWRSKALSIYSLYQQNLSREGDVVGLFELQEHWTRYLLETNQYEEAQKVGDELKKELSSKKVSTKLDAQSYKLQCLSLSRIAAQLLKHGKLNQAIELMIEVPLNLQGSFIFALTQYYKDQKMRTELLQLIGQMELELDAFNTSDGKNNIKSAPNRALLKQALSQANSAIDQISGLLDQPENDFEVLRRIQAAIIEGSSSDIAIELKLMVLQKQYSNLRIVLSQLLDHGNSDKVQGIVFELVSSLDDQNQSVDEGVELLLDLMGKMVSVNTLRDLLLDLIFGNGEQSSISELILLTNETLQPILLGKVMKLASITGNFDEVKRIKTMSLNKFDHHHNNINVAYALSILQNDQHRAIELLRTIPDKVLVAREFKSFLKLIFPLLSFYQFRPLLEIFADLDQNVTTSEDQIEETTVIADGYPDVILIPTNDPGHSDASKYQQQLPFLLCDLALLAIKGQKWGVFKQLMSDERMANDGKVRVIQQVTNWLIDGKEVEL